MVYTFRSTCLVLVVMFAWLFGGGGALAESVGPTDTPTDTIVQHLEFLGYQCEKLDQGIKATHPSKLGFVLIVLKDGLMAQSALAGTPPKSGDSKGEAAQKKAGHFSASNTLNAEATIARFFWTEAGELVIRASMLGAYDKRRFYTFMEAWEKDGQALSKHYEALKPYLK